MIIFTLFFSYTGSMAYQEQIVNNPDLIGKIINSAILLFGLIAGFILWWIIIKVGFINCSNCRNCWTVNSNKGIYVEKDDDLNVEAKLKEIKFKLLNSSPTFNDSGDKTKNNITNEMKIIVWFSVALTFAMILYLGFKGYIKESIFVPLVLFVAAIIIVLRFWQLKEEFNNLKWKK